LFKAFDDDFVSNRAEFEALAAGNDGWQDFLRFRRGKDELHVRRRLFQCFEQGVEGLSRQHVHFVDDVDLEGALGRRVLAVLAQVTDLIDRIVGRPVDLDHIHAVSSHDRLADRRIRWRRG